ncbi:MFS transporter [Ensifer adhaerens]|uniref:MFS transporter n=1 Tax=Ensifer adhaerens TaxID=106592 RepID=UPI0023A99776|nr:MFS transporter [Ensifer adhaerens]WDZ78834.1 MFS transporter [Ensifer adhaerens]
MSRSSGASFTFLLLVICTALSLAGTDLILPAVPVLPAVFSTSEATAQMVLAAYVGGSALGLLLFGRLADHFDRKTLMVAALAAFAATSLAGAFAPDMAVLIGLRFLQGIAASAAPVFAPGVIRQLFSEKKAVRAVGFLGSVESLVPALVPIAGVALLAHFGWQSSFELLGAAGAIVFVLMLAIGLPRQERATGRQGTYLQLLTDPVFMRYALSQAMTLGGLLTFVFGIPMVIVETMGGTLNDFIVVQIVNVAGFIVAANLTARIAERFGTEEVIMAGSAMAAASALALLAYGLAGGTNPLLVPVLFLPMGIGLGLRGPIGFYRGIVASGSNDARGSALIVFFVFMTTTLGTVAAAPVITKGLPALSLVVSAIHLLSVAILCALPKLKGAPSA